MSTAPIAPRKLVLVYVGSSRCPACNSPELPFHVAGIRESLEERATLSSIGFVTVGVASELSPVNGIEHLRKLSQFDEVSAGQGKLNQANLHFVAKDHAGLQATPQIVVLLRSLRQLPSGDIDYHSITEEVLVRKIGLRELRLWKEQGTPLPRVEELVPIARTTAVRRY